MSVRRSIGFVLFGVVVWWVSNLYAWRNDNFLGDVVGDQPVQSILFFGLLLAVLAVGAWTLYKPTWWKTLLAFGLGITTAAFGLGLFTGITWWFLFAVGVSIFVLVTLWVVTTWDDDSLPSWLPVIGKRSRTNAAAPAPAPAPAP